MHLKRKADKLQVGQRLLEIRVSQRNRRAASGWAFGYLHVSAALGQEEQTR